MKRLITPVLITMGLACVGQASAAVETYTVDLAGYAVVGFVGHTPEDFARAQQLANGWERERHLMLKPQSIMAVAIDQSQGAAVSQAPLHQTTVSPALAKTP